MSDVGHNIKVIYSHKKKNHGGILEHITDSEEGFLLYYSRYGTVYGSYLNYSSPCCFKLWEPDSVYIVNNGIDILKKFHWLDSRKEIPYHLRQKTIDVIFSISDLEQQCVVYEWYDEDEYELWTLLIPFDDLSWSKELSGVFEFGIGGGE